MAHLLEPPPYRGAQGVATSRTAAHPLAAPERGNARGPLAMVAPGRGVFAREDAVKLEEMEALGRDFAVATGLRYVHDDKPGFRRHGKTVKTFTYKDAHGRPISDAATLKR